MRRSVLAFTLCAVVGSATLAGAQGTAPSASAVLDKYVAAIGGPAWRKVSSRVVKATIQMPAAGVSMSATIWAARPAKTRTLIESDMIGKIERGYDGTVGWEINPMQGTRVFEGVELDNAARDGNFDGLVNWKDWVATADNKGPADVDGKPAWKIVVSPKRGAPQTYYFDQATGLAVKVEMSVQSAAGEVQSETYPGDYREVAGVRVPYRVRQTAGGQELVIVLDSVSFDTAIPASQFDPPKEIQALLASKKK